MKKELDILMVEDVAADAELIDNELHKAGLICHVTCVATKEDFLRELHRRPPDLILSDHGLPSFDGFTALAIARMQCPDAPFIFVTGALGEEVAIEVFESGAADYVLKNRLSNLVPAIQRALREVEERARRRKAEADRERSVQELQAALAKVKALTGLLPICSSCKKIRDEQGAWHVLEEYLQARTGATFTHGICHDCAKVFFPEGVQEKP
ncbi:MAG: response regulator [Limisphaerales bacterium]